MDKERLQEQRRVDNVVAKIKKSFKKKEQEYLKAHQETSSVEKNYVQNAKINTFEIDDRIETNAEVQQQKQLVAKNVETETILKGQLTTLNDLEKSPYFGRVDILDEDEQTPETLYIGISSFVDEKQNFLIYDWRAPISSIFYNGTLGKVSYDAPSGKQETDLLKKRQFLIQNAQIKNMFDTNETVGDNILQEILGSASDEYMKNIVATIQQEQNIIIRDTQSDLLLVQGVAGSGKTSAILQRIAFLLYHSRSELNADQFVLFSPNLLFSHYISEVLPSLGERNMRQVTLAEFFSQRFEGLNVETLFDSYEKRLFPSKEEHKYKQEKETASFMEKIKNYIHDLKTDDFQFTDIMLDDQVIFDKELIRATYASLPDAMSPSQRFFETKNLLIKKLKLLIAKETRKKWVLERIDSLNDEEYFTLISDYKRSRFGEVAEEENYLALKIVKDRFRTVYDAIYNNYFLDVYRQYSAFLMKNLRGSEISFNAELEIHRLSLADCAPLLYLRDLLTGGGQNQKIHHLFIDEIQDYSLAQLKYLKFAFPQAKLTLLGDSEQALFSDIQEPAEFLSNLKKTLNVKKARIIQLNKSYRSTSSITNFIKAMLPDGNKIQAFTRPGKVPKVLLANDYSDAIKKINTQIAQLLNSNSTIAIITNSMEECKQIYRKIHSIRPVTLIDNTARAVPQGVLILPIYLAKGLEFDAVIAYDISAHNYQNEHSLGTLYTICSRAMHELVLLSIGDVSPLIQKVPTKLFSVEHQVILPYKN
ncbi:RNA polymerase recycling motor HelD [Liquorilactobacillus uvarum]|uniref:ATP-dependent DNA helicase n=1 Tax=Liquorilactobacillus uvarum DSM 19971 TaxID=1423812 RepID=A0A0R1PYQ4_9LACO|nr:RNA polymerase recycling motor HelD [Liquorilactobacillus uvarum]KRL37673.1 ATP-dependent DNA helicase [Liquorilactobacillus uvarum DSM 19971]